MLQNKKTAKSYSEMQKCWVPNCLNSRVNGYTRSLFLLPINTKYREIWLSIAGRKITDSPEDIYFCQDHFLITDMEIVTNKAVCLKRNAMPHLNMPQKICRTCMSLISDRDSFSILSRTIPSMMPPELVLNLPQCRPEPLYQMLSFCIPDLNLQDDPVPLVCSKCYQNIWHYFVFKINSNAVEKGLCGNLTPEEYGKMVLCRTCPQTSGTSFFIISDETLMGSILKKMFLNEYPSDVVPLKVCLKCWNTLFKLKNFFEQCMVVDQKLQRHISLQHIGLDNIGQYPSSVPTLLDTSKTRNQLRDVRKISLPKVSPIVNALAYPQVPGQIMEVAESSTKFQASSNVNNPVSLPVNSVMKFTSHSEEQPHLQKMENKFLPLETAVCLEQQVQTPKILLPQVENYSMKNPGKNENRPDLQYQEQNNYHSRGCTWVPPLQNAKPIPKQKRGNTWVPPVANSQVTSVYEQPNTLDSSVANLNSSTKLVTNQGNINTWIQPPIINAQPIPNQDNYNAYAPVANLKANVDQEAHGSRNVTQFPSSSTESYIKPLEKNDSEKKIAKRSRKTMAADDRISLAKLMLKYGEPLKRKSNAGAQFDAWINIVKDFHKISDQYPLESIQYIWTKMKKRAELQFQQIGPASYEDHLVMNYLFGSLVNNKMTAVETTIDLTEEDCDTCLNNEMRVDQNITDKEKIEELNLESGGSSKIPQEDNSMISKRPLPSNDIAKEIKLGRPRKNQINEIVELSQKINEECDKSLKTKRKLRTPKKVQMNETELTHKINKECDENLKNNNVISPKSTKRKNRGRSKGIIGTPDWGFDSNLKFIRTIRKEYDKSLKNNEIINCRSPWKMLIQRLANGKYKDFSFERLYYIWCKMKKSATIYEKNGQDLVDEEVWELLQIQTAVRKSIIKDSNCTKTSDKVSATVENNDPQVSIENRSTPSIEPVSSKPSSNSDCNSNSSTSSSNSDCINKTSDVGHTVSTKTSPVSNSKLHTKSTIDCKQNYKNWTEDEKLEFFKLVAQEFNSMVKSKELIGRPWSRIIQRIASRGYKDCNPETLFKSWASIRRNASDHENSTELTVLDRKVLRLLKLANKLRNVKTAVKIAKDSNDQNVPNDTAHSKTTTRDNAKATTKSETVLIKNKRKITSKSTIDKDNKKIRRVVAPSNGDKNIDDAPNDGNKDLFLWSLKERLDLIDTIKSYGSEVFKIKRGRNGNFWSYIVTDHNSKGYEKDKRQVTSRWYQMEKSAKLAWAQQKETSPCDKAIIEFMIDMIDKTKEVANSDENTMQEEEESDNENGDDSEIEGTNTPIIFTKACEVDKESDIKGDIDDETDVEFSYDYVSLKDIENNYGLSIAENKIAKPIKTEISYVSMEDCAITVNPRTQSGEIIVIEDSDEEL